MAYTKAILQITRLNDLRDIARSLGVKSPTTRKKEQLINDIISAQEGKIEVTLTKRGRKPLSRFTKPKLIECGKCKAFYLDYQEKLIALHNEYIEKVNKLFNEYNDMITKFLQD